MLKEPNFLICGTCAAGCSQLTAVLKQHPEVFLPENHRPEPHFFYKDYEYEKGVKYYLEKYFSDVSDEKAIGETSGSYMMGLNTAIRIFNHFPNMKIILQLRSPALRAYANYRATVVHGLEPLDFEEALYAENRRIKGYQGIWKYARPFSYMERSLYYKQLINYLNVFPKENILIFKSEDTRRNPNKAFETCFEFVGVDNKFLPVLPPTYSNRSVKDRFLQTKIRDQLGSKIDLIVDCVEKEIDPMQLASSKEEEKIIKQFQNNLQETLAPIPENAKKYMNTIFTEERESLSKILPFDISEWYL